ncbi:hypothetical protein G6F57_022170 [Rhizopus arrhizus]|nr:hypothetical protein G6F57_022170 [Rhizopus arrhizus]
MGARPGQSRSESLRKRKTIRDQIAGSLAEPRGIRGYPCSVPGLDAVHYGYLLSNRATHRRCPRDRRGAYRRPGHLLPAAEDWQAIDRRMDA